MLAVLLLVEFAVEDPMAVLRLLAGSTEPSRVGEMISVKVADSAWIMEVMKQGKHAHFGDRSLKVEQRAGSCPYGDAVPRKMRN